MELLPQFFPVVLPDLLPNKGEIMGLDQVKFGKFLEAPNAEELARVLTPFWTDDDFRALRGWCSKIDCDPEELLLVLTSESRLRPDAMNPATGFPLAAGLNQMTRIAFQAIDKLPKDDNQAKQLFPALAWATAKMSVAAQFDSVVVPYFLKVRESFKGKWTPAGLYMANAAPSQMNKSTDVNAVIYPKGSAAYDGNKGLDTNGDGQVTTRDLQNAVEYHRETPEYVAAKYRFRVANGLPLADAAAPSALMPGAPVIPGITSGRRR